MMQKYHKLDKTMQFQETMNKRLFYLPMNDTQLCSLIHYAHVQYVKFTPTPQDQT